MNEDERIIREYREAFRKYAKDGVIDLDSRLKYKFDFQVHRMEDIVRQWQGIVPPMRQSQFFITLVKKGEGEKTIGRFSFPLLANTLFIIPQRVIHSSRYWTLDVEGYFLSFNLEFFLQSAFPRQHIENKLLFKHTVRPYLRLTSAQVEKLQVIYEYLIAEYRDSQPRRNEMMAIKVLELIVLCDRYYTEADASKEQPLYNEVVERFSALIQKNYTRQRAVAFYAKALHVHPNHLNQLVKKCTGLTAKETIDDYVLSEARFLLVTTALTVKEVAYQLGFEDPDRFSAFFRRKLKLSPSQYKVRPI